MSIKIKNCRIKISFVFSALLALAAILDKSGYVVVGLIVALIHEIGHLSAMAVLNRLPDKIHIGFMNANISDCYSNERSFRQDLIILLSGPLFNLLFFVVCFIISNMVADKQFAYEMNLACISNLLACVFNLLPIRGLDGGAILLILLTKKLNFRKSMLVLRIISLLMLTPMFFLGFLVLLQSNYNFSLLIVSCCLLYTTLFKY